MEVTQKKIPFLVFLREVVMQSLKTHGTARLRPGPLLHVRGGAGESVRRDGMEHWIVGSEGQKLRCKLCNGRYVLYYTVQYRIVHYSIVQYCTVPYCTLQYCTVLYSTALYSRYYTEYFRSFFKCEKCNVGLHPKCFKIWHTARG